MDTFFEWLRARFWLLVALLGLMIWGCHAWTRREMHPSPGILVAEEPLQGPAESQDLWTFKGYRFRALASFDIRARVLGTERYRWDRGAELSPIDLALGWGRMSDSAVLDKIHITQGNRWYLWFTAQFPIPQEEIISHSANMHMIPATSFLGARLKDLRVGQVVHIRGNLVSIEGPDDFHWTSSLSRKDSGDGACEVVWVDTLDIPPVISP
jgi:hypothetical protein